jgi:hypothetical protein
MRRDVKTTPRKDTANLRFDFGSWGKQTLISHTNARISLGETLEIDRLDSLYGTEKAKQ